jgi:hypothetical protein
VTITELKAMAKRAGGVWFSHVCPEGIDFEMRPKVEWPAG